MRLTPDRAAGRRDEGFTLVEVVVTVAILGIIAAVLCGVVLQYLKTSGVTDARLNESVDQQFVSTYWQADVSSIGRRSFTPGAADPLATQQSVFLGGVGPGACGAVGAPVVSLAWTEFAVDAENPDDAWDATVQKVVYVTIDPPPGGAPFVLKRIRCHDGVADPAQTVARNLTRRPEIACSTACEAAALPNRISMTIRVKDPTQPNSQGYSTTVTADRRQG